MTITELIKFLQKVETERGDLECVLQEPNEYWGTVETPIEESNIKIELAQPDGPKSGKSEYCVVFKL